MDSPHTHATPQGVPMNRTWIARFTVRVAVAAGCLFVCSTTVHAQPNMKPFPPKAETPTTGVDAPYFKDTELGAHVDYGTNGSPGQGYPHRQLPDVHYGTWYRPNSLMGQSDWCRALPFNPRGNGAPQHNACERLDYAPYVLSVPHSQYGPYYYPRAQKYNCCHKECQNGALGCRNCR